MWRSIKQNRFGSYAAEKEAKMDSRDPTCADMSYAFCMKFPESDGNLCQIKFLKLFAGLVSALAAIFTVTKSIVARIAGELTLGL
jgi:hypothetical protein